MAHRSEELPQWQGGFMKRVVFLFVVVLSGAIALSGQQPANSDACKFKVSESTTKPAISGPDDIVKLVHVIEQPDSPVEITSIDFAGGWLSVSNEQFTEQLKCKIRVRNRSDKPVQEIRTSVFVGDANGGVGNAGQFKAGLTPGQEEEFDGCGSRGGGGSGGAKNNSVRVVVAVEGVDLGNCVYRPSRLVPKNLGISLWRWY